MTNALRIDGVDISHHQRNIKINWSQLKKAGVKWMYHKATEGNSWVDPAYSRRRQEARNNGMPFGAYHFARPDRGDALAEARHFMHIAQPRPGDLRPVLDLETNDALSGPALVTWADKFCDEVAALCGAQPVVYTPYVLSKELHQKSIFWVPRYSNSNKQPAQTDWDIWQFSDGVYGVPNSVKGLGRVDLNYSKVPLDKLLIPKKDRPNTPPVKLPAGSRGVNIDVAIGKITKVEKNTKPTTPVQKARKSTLRAALDALKKIKPPN